MSVSFKKIIKFDNIREKPHQQIMLGLYGSSEWLLNEVCLSANSLEEGLVVYITSRRTRLAISVMAVYLEDTRMMKKQCSAKVFFSPFVSLFLLPPTYTQFSILHLSVSYDNLVCFMSRDL